MMNGQKKATASRGCCEGLKTGLPGQKSEEMFRMMAKFRGQGGPFNCGEMMEKFRSEDGSVDCKKMMEAFGRMCATAKHESRTEI